MAFYDDLNISFTNRIDENIRECGLDSRMQMDLRLLEQDDRAFRGITTLNQDRKDLRYAETNVGYQYLRRVLGLPDAYLVLLAVSSELSHRKGFDEIHFLE